jgi:hypothetical protein
VSERKRFRLWFESQDWSDEEIPRGVFFATAWSAWQAAVSAEREVQKKKIDSQYKIICAWEHMFGDIASKGFWDEVEAIRRRGDK